MNFSIITNASSTSYAKVYSDTITVIDGVYQINWRAFITGKVCIRLLIDDVEIIKKAYLSDGLSRKSCIGFLDKPLRTGDHVMALEFRSQDGLAASITGCFVGIMEVQYLEDDNGSILPRPTPSPRPITRKSTTKQDVKPISTTIGKRDLDL